MQNLQSLGLASLLLISIVGASPAFCDDDDEVKPPTKPLSGHVVVEDSPAQAAPVGLQAPVASQALAPKKAPRQAVKLTAMPNPVAAPMPAPVVHKAQIAQEAQPAVDPRQMSFHMRHQYLQANLSADDRAKMANLYRMHARFQPPMVAQATQNVDSVPYIWAQNFAGGYLDMSGHVKEMVWGDKLGAYGGKFFDGTPVPKGPVTLNSRGHIWWQPALSPGYFVKRETTNL